MAAGYYGKLVDGVITFNPATILVVDDDMKPYQGYIKLVLPSAGSDEPSDEGTETTSVSKSAKVTTNSFELHMSKGRVANLDIQPEVRTVRCGISVLPAANSQSIDRNSAINTFDLR